MIFRICRAVSIFLLVVIGIPLFGLLLAAAAFGDWWFRSKKEIHSRRKS